MAKESCNDAAHKREEAVPEFEVGEQIAIAPHLMWFEMPDGDYQPREPLKVCRSVAGRLIRTRKVTEAHFVEGMMAEGIARCVGCDFQERLWLMADGNVLFARWYLEDSGLLDR